MLEGITIPYDLADEITAANLKNARGYIIEDIDRIVRLPEILQHEKTNLQDNYMNLFVIEKCLDYFTVGDWRDE
jgi:hypothetical protein